MKRQEINTYEHNAILICHDAILTVNIVGVTGGYNTNQIEVNCSQTIMFDLTFSKFLFMKDSKQVLSIIVFFMLMMLSR